MRKIKQHNSKLMYILIILAIGILIVSCNPQKTTDTKINTQFPEGQIIIEKDDSVAGSYGPQCANKNYWVDSADWIVEVIVENVEQFNITRSEVDAGFNESVTRTTSISTSRIEKYIKGEPVTDKLIINTTSGYSTSGDMDILLEEGNRVRVYLIEAYKVTGLEEHKGVFGFVCKGVEEIK